MSIDYNNIDDMLNLINDFRNNDTDKISSYTYKPFNPEQINIDDIVKDENFNYRMLLGSKNGNSNIISSFGDNKNKKVIIKKNQGEYNITIIIQEYENNNSLDIIHDLTYELMINQLISEYVLIKKVPFYLLNIFNVNIELNRIKPYPEFYNLILKEFNIFEPELDIYKNKVYCFSVYEHYSDIISLKELLNKELTKEELNSIFFQIIFMYGYLLERNENFIHGSFNVDSILIEINDKNREYNISMGDTDFKFNERYICKLFNYRKSKITTKITDPTFELYTMFTSIYNHCNTTKNKNIDNIKLIISNFVPLDIINNNYTNIHEFSNNYIGTIIPLQILNKNIIFSKFINMTNINKINNSNKFSIKNDDASDKSLTENGKIVGYRLLGRKSLQDGGKPKKLSKSTKSSKSSKTTKKSKKSKKQKGGETDESDDESREEVEHIDDISDSDYDEDDEDDEDEEINKKNKKDKKLKEDYEDMVEDEEEESKNRISIQDEEENFETEGDDSNHGNNDDDEMGLGDNRLMRKIMKENMKLKKQLSSENKPNIMLPNKESTQQNAFGMPMQRMGTNNDINSILNNLPENAMIPLLPEMQEMYFKQNPQFQTNGIQHPPMNMGQPEIMDQGILKNLPQGGIPGLSGFPGMEGMNKPMLPMLSPHLDITKSPSTIPGLVPPSAPSAPSAPAPSINNFDTMFGGSKNNFFFKKN